MAIALRGKSQGFNADGASTSVAVPLPAGVVATDRVLVCVGSIGSSATITTPSGWTKVTEDNAGSQLKAAIYYRDATGTDPASTTWAFSAAGRNFGYALAYSGVDLAVAPVATAVADVDGAALTTPAQQVLAGDWLASFAVGRQNPGTDTAKSWTSNDAADVEHYDLYSTNTGTSPKLTAAAWDSGRALAAGTAQRTLTANLAMGQLVALSVRLAAPVAAPVTGVANPWTYLGIPQR